MVEAGGRHQSGASTPQKFPINGHLQYLGGIHSAFEHHSGDTSEEEAFNPHHTLPGCNCPLIGLDGNTIPTSTLLRGDQTPLITVDAAAAELSGSVELSVTTTLFGTGANVLPFVAISHVRSEGLGNSKANTLPTCTLLRLQRKVDAVAAKKSTPFWIDTLCIPVKPAASGATINIRSIFEAATHVLVTCKSVTDSYAKTSTRRLAAIGKSAWLSRVWTLQEGAVAKSLSFQFATGFVDYRSLLKTCPMTEDADQWLHLLGLMSDEINGVRLRKFKRSRNWDPPHTFSKTKLNLRKLLRIGYLCVPQFIGFASEEEKNIAMRHLKPTLNELYGDQNGTLDPFERLDHLRDLAELVLDSG